MVEFIKAICILSVVFGHIFGAEDEVNTTEKVMAGLGVKKKWCYLGRGRRRFSCRCPCTPGSGGGAGRGAVSEDSKAVFMTSHWHNYW